jgi:hypothetical protein
MDKADTHPERLALGYHCPMNKALMAELEKLGTDEKQRLLNPGDPVRLNDCAYLGATVTCTSL